MHLSVVIPVYNSATSINQVVGDCFAALSHLDFEIVLVDDGSADNSEEVIFQLAQQRPNIKAISLAKNVGEFNAVMCGLRFAAGKYVAIIDDDGQNPPAEILKLLAEAEKGALLVYARYKKKKHSTWRNIGSSLNNLLATIVIGKPYNLYLSSFKLVHYALYKGICLTAGPKRAHIDSRLFYFKYAEGKIATVLVEHKESLLPNSRYNFKKLLRVTLDMITNAKRSGTIYLFLELIELALIVFLTRFYLPIMLGLITLWGIIFIVRRRKREVKLTRPFKVKKLSFTDPYA